MKAVLRLVWTYFTATPLMRGLAAIGTGLMLFGISADLLLPSSDLTNAMRGQWSGPLPFLAIFVPWIGLILLLASTVLMPSIVERIALGRSVWVLPGGRVRILASVLLAALLLATFLAVAAAIAFSNYFAWDTGGKMFSRTLVMTFIDLGLVYTPVWLAAKTQGVWRLVGVLVALISMTIPLRLIAARGEPFSWLEWSGISTWLVFGALLLWGGRLRHSLRNLKQGLVRTASRLAPDAGYKEGKEFDLMLGITHPWLLAFGQVIPIAAMVALIKFPDAWLAVLTMFSGIAGAITSQAAPRSRVIWLRRDWNRTDLVHRVELAFWRFNASSLVVLFVFYCVLAIYYGFTPPQIANGCILLALGFAACTNLGLMITRGLGMFESALCVFTLVTMGIAAVATMRGIFLVAIELEVMLAALAMIYRYLALARWQALDWMRCRPATSFRAAGV